MQCAVPVKRDFSRAGSWLLGGEYYTILYYTILYVPYVRAQDFCLAFSSAHKMGLFPSFKFSSSGFCFIFLFR